MYLSGKLKLTCFTTGNDNTIFDLGSYTIWYIDCFANVSHFFHVPHNCFETAIYEIYVPRRSGTKSSLHYDATNQLKQQQCLTHGAIYLVCFSIHLLINQSINKSIFQENKENHYHDWRLEMRLRHLEEWTLLSWLSLELLSCWKV